MSRRISPEAGRVERVFAAALGRTDNAQVSDSGGAAIDDPSLVLVSDLKDIRWACGFTGSNALLLIGPGFAELLTDGRYREQAESEVVGASVRIVSGSLLAALPDSVAAHPASAITVQGDVLTLAHAANLGEMLPHVPLRPVSSLLTGLRASKSDLEVEAIAAAQRLTESVLTSVLEDIRPGMTEAEIAAEITYRHLRAGASAMSFDPIVAAGENAAMPHARPTSRRVGRDELILVDIGCYLCGYASDMTRMLCFGTPGAEEMRAVESVKRALMASHDAAKPGMASSALDRIARQSLAEDGLESFFSHSLGHGVGLDVHEAPPVSYRSDETLPDRAVITLEPGVYRPGLFGVRIEDMVVLEKEGCRSLNEMSPDLIQIDRDE